MPPQCGPPCAMAVACARVCARARGPCTWTMDVRAAPCAVRAAPRGRSAQMYVR